MVTALHSSVTHDKPMTSYSSRLLTQRFVEPKHYDCKLKAFKFF